MLMDIGAVKSYLNPKFKSLFGENVQPSHVRTEMASGQTTGLEGQVTVDLTLDGITEEISFGIPSALAYDAIIGMDAMEKFGIVIHTGRGGLQAVRRSTGGTGCPESSWCQDFPKARTRGVRISTKSDRKIVPPRIHRSLVATPRTPAKPLKHRRAARTRPTVNHRNQAAQDRQIRTIFASTVANGVIGSTLAQTPWNVLLLLWVLERETPRLSSLY